MAKLAVAMAALASAVLSDLGPQQLGELARARAVRAALGHDLRSELPADGVRRHGGVHDARRLATLPQQEGVVLGAVP